jgi:hypothetical protein
VIQNGCATAFESVIQGIPLISFGPDIQVAKLGSISNTLGVRAKTIEDLDNALECIFEGDRYDDFQIRSEAVIEPLVSYAKDNPALEIVKIMEAKSQFPPERRLTRTDLLKLRFARHSKNLIDGLRRLFKFKAPAVRSYTLDAGQIRGEISGMAEVMGLPVPKVRMIGKTGILVEKA